ncbi:hypothetical protein [uncultured Marinobacter sp.]|uniref:hypothetical protein n=1 Tax=uncultured Marinobacter sp. TaxID=187379 RepID=UPI0030D81A90
MRIADINPRTTLNANSTISVWNEYTTAEGGVANLVDTDNVATGWSWVWDETAIFGNGISDTSAQAGTGDASWVDQAVVFQQGHGTNDAAHWEIINISGLDNSKKYTIQATSYGPSGRNTDYRVNGGAAQNVPNGGNTTVIASFEDISPADGVIIFEVKRGDTSTGWSYFNAARIIETDGPPVAAITITSTLPITPGSTVTGTYENFNVTPTGATFSDGVEGEVGVNTLSTATAGQLTAFSVTNTDTAGVHSGTFSFVTPSLPTSGNRQMIKFGPSARVRLF